MRARGRPLRTRLVASSSASAVAHPKPLRTLLFLLATTALTGTALAQPKLPTGGQVVGGSGNATINKPNDTTLQIQQSTQSVIINWNSFNIGYGYTTKFLQPDGGVALNRVKSNEGHSPSEIFGTLKATGTIFLVNPDGIIIGPNTTIQTGGFLATTSDIKNSDFMAGRYDFAK